MAVETLKNLLSSDLLEQTMINGYTELYDDMDAVSYTHLLADMFLFHCNFALTFVLLLHFIPVVVYGLVLTLR